MQESRSFNSVRILYVPIVHGFIIIVSGVIAYSNTFHAPFYFDDILNIVDNYSLRDLNNFLPPSGPRWLGYLSFALNYHFGGLDTLGYHAINLTIHILNAILVYWLVLLTLMIHDTSRSDPARRHASGTHSPFNLPLFSALLFVAHPIQTQAVTYIVQRFTSLATFFYLLSLVMYVKFRMQDLNPPKSPFCKGGLRGIFIHHASWLMYLASLFSAILAMKTKEIAFTLPVVITLYEFMFFEGKIKKRILFLMPLLLTMLIIPLSIIGTDKPIGDAIGEIREAAQETEEIPRWSYLFTQFRVIVTYIRLLFFPINQNLDYDYPVFHSFFNPEVFLSLLFLLLIFSFGIYLLYSTRYTLHPTPHPLYPTRYSLPATRLISFGIFWFFITLSVESSIIPIRDVINEHRLYLSGIGIYLAAPVFLYFASDNVRKVWPPAWKLFKLLPTVIILVLLGAAYARNELWKDEVRLWENVTAGSPEKARGYNGLGLAFENKKQYTKAIEAYDKAIALDMIYMPSYINRGAAYNNMGLYDKAARDFSMVIKMYPMNVNAYFNRGVAYLGLGLNEKAIEDYARVIAMAPNRADAYNNRGAAFEKMGQLNKAIEDYTRVIDIDSGNALAFYNRAMAYMSVGDSKNAGVDFKRACELGSAAGCNATASVGKQ